MAITKTTKFIEKTNVFSRLKQRAQKRLPKPKYRKFEISFVVLEKKVRNLGDFDMKKSDPQVLTSGVIHLTYPFFPLRTLIKCF